MMQQKDFRFFSMLLFCMFGISMAYGQGELQKSSARKPIIRCSAALSDTSASSGVVIVSVREFEKRGGSVHPSDQRVSTTGWHIIKPSANCYYWVDSGDPLEILLKALPRNRNTLVYVHGFGHDFYSMARVGARMAKRYGVNVVMFDWPSKSINFLKVKNNISNTAAYFQAFVNEVSDWYSVQPNDGTHLSLMMHSLGNGYLTKAIEKRYNVNLQQFSNVILNSPAISCTSFDEMGCDFLSRSRVYIMQNPNDRVLKWTSRLLSEALLGNSLSEAACSYATSLDFEAVASKEHTFFLGITESENRHPVIFDVYNCLINGKRLDARAKNSLFATNAAGLYTGIGD